MRFVIEDKKEPAVVKRITYTIILLIFDYIKYIPLTVVFLYVLFIILYLSAGTPFGVFFITLLRFPLGKKGQNVDLTTSDTNNIVLIWWFVLATISQVLSKLFKGKVKNFNSYLVFSILLLALSVPFMIKIGMFFGPLLFYLFSLASFKMYQGLSKASDNLRESLRSDI